MTSPRGALLHAAGERPAQVAGAITPSWLRLQVHALHRGHLPDLQARGPVPPADKLRALHARENRLGPRQYVVLLDRAAAQPLYRDRVLDPRRDQRGPSELPEPREAKDSDHEGPSLLQAARPLRAGPCGD